MKRLLLIFLLTFNVFAIVDGQKVSQQNPLEKYHVSWNIEGSHFCSGVIIHPRFILTAAHCVGDKRHQVRFGTSQIQRKVKKVFIHPDYTAYRTQMPYPNGMINDLAVLELESDIPKGYATLKPYRTLNSSGRVILFGYGKISETSKMGELHYKELKVIDYLIESGEWITSYGACGGDSGGALIYQEKNTIKLIGITSRSDKRNPTNGCMGPSVQTDLIHQMWWLKNFL